MNSIQLFENAQIRFVEHPEQKFAFGIVAEDLAKVLEASRGADIARSVNDKWLGSHIVQGNAGTRSVTVIWEPGIYQILAKSRKPKAQVFQDWLFEQVLPEIREKGSFGTQNQQHQLNQQHQYLQLSPSEKVETAHKILDSIFSNVSIKPELLAGIKLNIAQKNLPELAGDIEESRQLLITNTAQKFELLTPTEIGKRLGISGQAVNKKLIEMGFQIKNEDKKSKKEPSYLPIGSGKEFSDLTLASGSNDSGTYQQLRWYSSVLSQF